jgi:Holliday junction resolvasome RuvABC ATP-dependent DNA helicase subunit
MMDDIVKHSSDNQGILEGSCLPVDREPEILSLRPEQFSDYVGQTGVVEALKIAI